MLSGSVRESVSEDLKSLSCTPTPSPVLLDRRFTWYSPYSNSIFCELNEISNVSNDPKLHFSR